jgi:hypothetical protein
MNLNHILIILLCSLTLGFMSCKKMLEVDAPSTSITGGNVFDNDVTAAAVLTGLYTKLSGTSSTSFDVNTTTFWTGLSADELSLWSGVSDETQIAFYNNSLLSNKLSDHALKFWEPLYRNIFSCNSAIEGLLEAKDLTPTIRLQLLGEAKFMRAYFYFYLVNLFGDIPLVLSTDYKLNSGLSRSSKILVHQQIIADLKDAQNLLSENYLKANAQTPYSAGTEERVRPTKWAATALLSRIYLYTQDWVQAEAQANTIIDNASLYYLEDLSSVFLKNSTEAIWQLFPVGSYVTNTQEAYVFIIPPTGPSSNGTNPVYISPQQLNSFELNDQRKNNWVSSVTAGSETFYFPFKYKAHAPNAPVSEYTIMLRLGEQYLIRAEARAEQNNISGAQDDLNAIRNRAGLLNTSANDKPSLLTAILHERQVELFTEGHRWFDLKRTGKVDEVMSVVTPLKGGTWNTNWQLYPLPFYDLEKVPNLRGHQNPGY